MVIDIEKQGNISQFKKCFQPRIGMPNNASGHIVNQYHIQPHMQREMFKLVLDKARNIIAVVCLITEKAKQQKQKYKTSCCLHMKPINKTGNNMTQGTWLTPGMLNIYRDKLSWKKDEHHFEGGRNVNNLHYAEDIILVTGNANYLEVLN